MVIMPTLASRRPLPRHYDALTAVDPIDDSGLLA
jgi:hypothetical protein